MRNAIRGAVGKGQLNRPEDVRVVQRLLNKYSEVLALKAPLDEDGILGNKTSSAILALQRQSKLAAADGIVHPGGPTLRYLSQPVQQPADPKKPAMPAHVEKFLNMALPTATNVKERWGIPVSVLLAQAAIESGWGRHVKGNAYFGIKGKSPKGASTKFGTTEFINHKKIAMQDEFRSYADFEEAAHDYGRFLNENKRYKAAFEHKENPVKFVEHIAKAGYATDPEYHTKVASVIKRFGFDKYDM